MSEIITRGYGTESSIITQGYGGVTIAVLLAPVKYYFERAVQVVNFARAEMIRIFDHDGLK